MLHVFGQAAVPSFSAKLSCQSYKLSSAKLQASKFCSAKLPFLSCQAPISVLPSTHFCPVKLIFPPPKYAYGRRPPLLSLLDHVLTPQPPARSHPTPACEPEHYTSTTTFTTRLSALLLEPIGIIAVVPLFSHSTPYCKQLLQ